MIENQDYEFVPVGDDMWHVRITSGEFIETVIMYDSLKLVDDQMHFNFNIIFSSVEGLVVEDEGLQKVVREMLFYILDTSVGHVE